MRKYPKPPGSKEERLFLPVRTMAEVAAILGISPNAVLETEARALAKLAAHPVIQQLGRDAGLRVETAGLTSRRNS